MRRVIYEDVDDEEVVEDEADPVVLVVAAVAAAEVLDPATSPVGVDTTPPAEVADVADAVATAL